MFFDDEQTAPVDGGMTDDTAAPATEEKEGGESTEEAM